MITLFRSNTLLSLEELKKTVYQHIKFLPDKISPIGTPQKILRYEFTCEPMNTLHWLHNNHHLDEKVYWSDRQGAFEMAGMDTADVIAEANSSDYKKLFQYFDNHLSMDNPHLRYYGGLSFSPSSIDGNWQSLGYYRFIIPQFEFFNANEETTFAFNIALKDIEEKKIEKILLTLDQINFSKETTYRSVPIIKSREDTPNQDEWSDIFNHSVNEAKRMSYEKIVLARKSTFEFDVAIRPSALLKHLKEQTPNCYHFCFQSDAQTAFLGASPERLYKRMGHLIESEAVAGTIKRGENAHEDSQLENDLLNSEKNQREHQYVVRAIEESLKKLCSFVSFDKNFALLKVKEGQHLLTRFKGQLSQNVNDADILSTLHPTPAVAGFPMKEALKAIEQIEPFKRGWYAGPVGYIGPNEVEFAVGIRSGLIHDKNLSLFAGAGIVEGSTAQEEWDEIESKISRFMKVFQK